jgi:hypothetical protein
MPTHWNRAASLEIFQTDDEFFQAASQTHAYIAQNGECGWTLRAYDFHPGGFEASMSADELRRWNPSSMETLATVYSTRDAETVALLHAVAVKGL